MPKLTSVTKELISNIKNSLAQYKLALITYKSEATRYQAENAYVDMMAAFARMNYQLARLEDDMSLENYEQLLELSATLYTTSVALHEKCNDIEMLSEVSSFAMGMFEQTKQTIEDERRIEDQTRAHKQAELKNAEFVSHITSQKRLNEVVSVRTSGYGYIYDTMPLIFEQIDNDSDLKLLAGSKYNELKDAINAYRVSVKNHVDGEARISESNRPELERVLTAVSQFSNEVTEYTRAFDRMITMVNGEVKPLLEACDNHDTALWRDAVNGQSTITPEIVRNYHREVVDEILKEDELEVTHAYQKSSQAAETEPGHLRAIYDSLDASLAAEDAYTDKDGKKIGGDQLREQIASNPNAVFTDLTQVRSLIYMDLRGKGISDTLAQIAFADKGKTDGEALKGSIVNDSRQEILDLAFTTDVKKIDDKISDIYVNSMIACEEELLKVFANPTNDTIISASFQLKPFADFYKMELPKYALLENGDSLVKESINRKLEAMGKPYRYEHMTSLVKAFGNISENEASRITKEGELSFEDSVNLASKIRTVRETISAQKKTGTTLSFVATVPTNFDQVVASHSVKYDKDTPKASLIRDTRYALGTRKIDELARKMKKEITNNGASKKFSRVYELTNQVVLLESLDANQDEINFVYGQLKQSCTEYLESRNPKSTASKERYKLVAQISDMVDGSASFRKELAQKIPKRSEHDIIDAGRTFLDNTHSVFGDSKKMTKIKSIVNKLSNAQMMGIDIPAVGGSVSYFELFKACADYVADPKKADNQRKYEVIQLMFTVAGKMNDPKITEIVNMTGRVEDRNRVARELDEYEKNPPIISHNDKSINDAIIKMIHTELPAGYELRLHKNRINSEYFIDGVFGIEIKPNADIEALYVSKPSGLKDPEGYIRNLPKIEFTEGAFEKAKIDPQLYPYLALMEYSINTYADGKEEYKKHTEEDDKSNFEFYVQNFHGGEIRQDIENRINPHCNIKKARENAKNMIEDAANGNVDKIAAHIAKGLKYLKPSITDTPNLSNKVICGYNFIGRYLNLVSKHPNIMKAIEDKKLVEKSDIVLLSGCAQAGEIGVLAAEAKSKVAQALYQGKELSQEEMIACKKAIVKCDMLAAEKRYMHETHDQASSDLQNQIWIEQEGIMNAMNEFHKIVISKEPEVTEEMKREAEKNYNLLSKKNEKAAGRMHIAMSEDLRIPPLLASLGTKTGKAYFDQYVNEMDNSQVTMNELADMLMNKTNRMGEYNDFCKKISKDFAPKKEEANAPVENVVKDNNVVNAMN